MRRPATTHRNTCSRSGLRPDALRHFFGAFALHCVAAGWLGCAAGAQPDQTTGAASSATVSASASSSSGTSGTGGIDVGSGGAGGGEVCTSTSAQAKPIPLDIVFLIDRSGSMAGAKWMGTTSALTSFFNDSTSAGIGTGLVFFPPLNALYPACDEMSYELLDVPIGPLPDNAFTLTNSLPANVATCCGTPMYAALKGTLMAATAYQDNHPTHKVNVVLATDGDPYGCDGVTIDAIAGLANSALGYDGVHTYVIGVQGSTIANLDKIAAGGGTMAAYDITQDISKLSATFAEIRNVALACEFGIPPPPNGKTLVPDYVNFTYTPGGTDTPLLLPRADDLADCGNQPGWYYDNNAAPTKIILCPASCTTVQSDSSAKVDVAFGCQSILN